MKIRKNLSGNRYGKIQVIQPTEKRNNGFVVYLCRCDCGNIKEISYNDLVSNHYKSCGCSRWEHSSETAIKHQTLKNNEGIYKIIYRDYIIGAEKRNLNFELPFDIFLELLNKKCFYCQIEPSTIKKRKSKSKYNSMVFEIRYNGIDRIDNSIGYTINNCITCCKDCNRAKSDMSLEEFCAWVKRLAKNLNNIEK